MKQFAQVFVPTSLLEAVILIVIAVMLMTACTPTLPTYAPTETPAPLETDVPTVTQTSTRTPTSAQTCTVSTGVPAGYLNLRTGAGVNHGVIDVLHEGDVLTVIAFGEWLEVTHEGKQGFINSRYCEMGD